MTLQKIEENGKIGCVKADTLKKLDIILKKITP